MCPGGCSDLSRQYTADATGDSVEEGEANFSNLDSMIAEGVGLQMASCFPVFGKEPGPFYDPYEYIVFGGVCVEVFITVMVEGEERLDVRKYPRQPFSRQ
jgi:hypothetical protein